MFESRKNKFVKLYKFVFFELFDPSKTQSDKRQIKIIIDVLLQVWCTCILSTLFSFDTYDIFIICKIYEDIYNEIKT